MSTTTVRYPTKEIADIEIYGHITKLRAVLTNLSLTGAGLEILGEQPLRKGDLINITIQLNSLAKSHNVDAEVIWATGPVLGVLFMKKQEIVERIFMKADG